MDNIEQNPSNETEGLQKKISFAGKRIQEGGARFVSEILSVMSGAGGESGSGDPSILLWRAGGSPDDASGPLRGLYCNPYRKNLYSSLNAISLLKFSKKHGYYDPAFSTYQQILKGGLRLPKSSGEQAIKIPFDMLIDARKVRKTDSPEIAALIMNGEDPDTDAQKAEQDLGRSFDVVYAGDDGDEPVSYIKLPFFVFNAEGMRTKNYEKVDGFSEGSLDPKNVPYFSTQQMFEFFVEMAAKLNIQIEASNCDHPFYHYCDATIKIPKAEEDGTNSYLIDRDKNPDGFEPYFLSLFQAMSAKFGGENAERTRAKFMTAPEEAGNSFEFSVEALKADLSLAMFRNDFPFFPLRESPSYFKPHFENWQTLLGNCAFKLFEAVAIESEAITNYVISAAPATLVERKNEVIRELNARNDSIMKDGIYGVFLPESKEAERKLIEIGALPLPELLDIPKIKKRTIATKTIPYFVDAETYSDEFRSPEYEALPPYLWEKHLENQSSKELEILARGKDTEKGAFNHHYQKIETDLTAFGDLGNDQTLAHEVALRVEYSPSEAPKAGLR